MLIEDLWKQHATLPPGQARLGLEIKAAIEQTDELLAAEHTPFLDAWLAIFDEFTSWFVSMTHIFEARLLDRKRPNHDIIPALTTLLSAVVAHLFAIRRLSIGGLDLAAKQVLRSLREYIDVALLLILCPAIASEFIAAQTPDASNQLWHKHISKGKATKLIYQRGYGHIDQRFNVQELMRWRKGEDDMLSMSAHPSYIAGVVRLLVRGSDDRWPGYLGVVSGGTVRTLNYTIMTLLDFLLIGKNIPFYGHDGLSPIVAFDERSEFHQHVQHGRYVLAELILTMKDGQLNNELSAPDKLGDWD